MGYAGSFSDAHRVIIALGNEFQLLSPCKSLQRYLLRPCFFDCFELLFPNQFYWPANLGVMRTRLGVIVFMKSAFEVSGTADIQSVVGTAENVGVGHE